MDMLLGYSFDDLKTKVVVFKPDLSGMNRGNYNIGYYGREIHYHSVPR